MSGVPSPRSDAPVSIDDGGSATPFGQVFVTLTKQAHIELVTQANYWKAQHRRAVERERLWEARYRELVERTLQHEAAWRAELELAQAKMLELKKRVFGRKTERSRGIDSRLRQGVESPRARGQQPGAPGHGRTRLTHLEARTEHVEMESPRCPGCGAALGAFAGTEDSEVVEIEVRAYRRVIRRQRYRPTCRCGCVPGIVAAPAPPRLIERGKFGVSVWVSVLLDKFLYGHPSHRLMAQLGDHGIELSAGTLTGGLQAIAPLFEPLEQALVEKLRSEQHWHADETRWQVFVETPGKVGHRWYLWVFHSPSVIHYVLDASRSAQVPKAELGGVQGGVISCDRYSAYKKFARQHPGFVLAFCWAHQRRDLLELANAYPDLSDWAMAWVARIGQLYHLQAQRASCQGADDGDSESSGSENAQAYAVCDQQLRTAVQDMAQARDGALADAALPLPARNVLQSMTVHWAGLTVFVDQPHVPMDNNAAERVLRPVVVARKNFYGSGSEWSGHLAAMMFSVLMTIKLYQFNPRTYLTAYLNACAVLGHQAPADLSEFLPWSMSAQQLAAMRALPGECVQAEVHDTS